MTQALPAPHPGAVLDDDAWGDLLDFIEDRRVIPIVGPELLKVDTETGPRLLYDWLAEKLAAKLGVDTALLPTPYTLNDVVCWFLSARGRREEAYTRLRSVLRDANFTPPRALSSWRRSPTSISSSARPLTRCSSRRSMPSASAENRRPKCWPTPPTASLIFPPSAST